MPAFDWNSNKNGNKVQVYSGWANYLDKTDKWKPIDCIIKETGSGFEITDAPFACQFPKTAGGVATFVCNNRYDIFTKKRITAMPFTMETRALDVDNSVTGEIFTELSGRGDAIIYRNAYPDLNADLIYYVQHGTVPKLKKLLRFNSKIFVRKQLKFWAKYGGKTEISPTYFRQYNNVITRMQARDYVNNELKSKKINHSEGFYIRAWDEPEKRGMGIEKPFIWDSSNKRNEISMTVEKYGVVGNNEYIYTKTIEPSFFDDAVLPVYTDAVFTFYPDPGTGSTTCDGTMYIFGFGKTWSDIRNGTGGTILSIDGNSQTNARFQFFNCHNTPNTYQNNHRMGYTYDTTTFTGNIESAKTIINVTSKADVGGTLPNYGMYSFNPTDPANFVGADIVTAGSTLLMDSPIEYNDLVIGKNDFVFDAAGIANINKGGITGIAVRNHNYDVLDVAFPWATGRSTNISADTADHADINKRPVLEITEAELLGLTRRGIVDGIARGLNRGL